MADLNQDDLLVLFEFCHRICETGRVAASHPAEVALIDRIAGELERSLAEPFAPDYSDKLSQARRAVLAQHQAGMGTASWITAVALDQT